jgi:hypothetical protein
MTRTTFDPPEPDDRSEPERWERLGISRQDALAWCEHRIEPDGALRWRRAGVTEPIDAVRWKIASVTPDTVREWVYAEIDAREAVGWTELGFNVAEARKHKRAGRTAVQAYGRLRRSQVAAVPQSQVGAPHPGTFAIGPHAAQRLSPGPSRFMDTVGRRNPQVVHSYVQRRWFDDEAIAWASHDIEASDALAWKELGLTPVEAERQQAQGLSAMQAAKAWWRAGIPFDEVADWIGAGLSAAEAAEQRAKGVTAERAAVLRSLRQDQ